MLAIDAYRGLVMLALASGGLGIHATAGNFPNSPVWQALGYQFTHVAWVGCSLWDLIQPSFMFIVGVSMAFSCAGRAAKGQSYRRMLLHACLRAVVLVLLGVFLRSKATPHTNWTFVDVVSQIGMGYVPLFLLWNRKPALQIAVALLILAGYGAWFYFTPLPAAGFEYASVGVEPGWRHLEGTPAHWEKNTNPAAAVDRWLLNRFPRDEPFRYDKGGYTTLNFISSLATMILGLVAGGLLRSGRTGTRKLTLLLVGAMLMVAAGLALHMLGAVPIVKSIWTPSWALFAGGLTTLLLATFYGVVELLGLRRWTFPLVVVGANSLLIYCMSQLLAEWMVATLHKHFGRHCFEIFGATYGPALEPLVRNVAVLALLWLVCWWLYRQRIFVRL